jgi:uncharacterized membrane protein YeaQ/YmgE (transglycosylase-associated protein family)
MRIQLIRWLLAGTLLGAAAGWLLRFVVSGTVAEAGWGLAGGAVAGLLLLGLPLARRPRPSLNDRASLPR